MKGLILDESEGLLYFDAGHRIFTVVVETAFQAFLTRVDPVLRTWCLMQDTEEERAQMIPAAAAEDARAARARETLRLLMKCPISDVAFRVCGFAF